MTYQDAEDMHMPKSKVDKFVKEASELPDFQQEFAKQRYDEYRGRRGKELELWKKWDAGGRKEKDLKPLLQSIEPLINSETKKRLQGLGGSMPQAALKQTLRNAAVQAVGRYDPAKSQLSTFLTNSFMAVSDTVSAARNQFYMPRPDVEQHQRFMSARDQFLEETGREPTPAEMQERLPDIGLRRLRRLSKGFSPEAYTDMGTDFDEGAAKPDVRDAFLLVKPELGEAHRQFGELHYPPAGTQQMSVAQIAKQLKVPSHRAYQIKSEVEKRLERILKKE